MNEISKILEKKKNRIMESILGSKWDENGQKYSYVYKHEWNECKECISAVFEKMFDLGFIDHQLMPWIILSELGMCIGFEEDTLYYDELTNICEEIKNEFIRC